MHEIVPGNRNSYGAGPSPPYPDRSLPTQVRVEIAKHKVDFQEKRYDNSLRSCCFTIDKRVLEWAAQIAVGIGVIIFCCVMLSTADCESSPPYWSLLGSIIGFFLKAKIKQ
jgi:hypothetical protein